METKKPTQEQIKEFWERCGWHEEYFEGEPKTVWAIFRPDGSMDTDGYPPIDLNNLFKYAVPKLKPEVIKFVPLTDSITGGYGLGWGCHLTLKGWAKTKAVVNKEYNPALALFWAVWEVIKGRSDRKTATRGNNR